MKGPHTRLQRGFESATLWPAVPPFLARLDFYGSVLELLGLTILLSYDVPFLQPQLMRVPRLRRRHQALIRLKVDHGRFDESRHTMYVPERTMRLEKEDAGAFLALYPDWRSGKEAPGPIFLYAVHGNPAQSNEPWIFPSNEQEEPLATALFLSTMFVQEEREIERMVYGIGFALMLAGGILSLAHIMHS